MFSITGRAKPIVISVKLHNKHIQMELNTGATLCICRDKLYAVSYHGPEKWIPVKVTKVTGPLSYQVETESGITL